MWLVGRRGERSEGRGGKGADMRVLGGVGDGEGKEGHEWFERVDGRC